MADRTHEYLLSGSSGSYDRLGIRYTQGAVDAEFLRPDSQHSEQSRNLTLQEAQGLLNFLEEVVPLMQDANEPAEA
jgi:hypothetical protein